MEGLRPVTPTGRIEDMFDSDQAGYPCGVRREDGRPCGDEALVGAPVPVCRAHAAVIGEWVAAEYGVTDVLPGACRACGSRLGVHYPSGWVCAACEWRVGDVLDDGLPPPHVDIVYYLRFGDRIKIGTTANPRQRLARLWHDEVLAFEKGDRLLEHRRHREFAAARLGRSEWFASSPDLEEHIGALAAGVEDPWARYARWLGEAVALRG